MVNKGIETATTGAGWLKGGPQMVSDVVCGIVDTWVSVIDPNEGTIRKAMSGDAATLDELASLASTIGSIVFVVYVCMTAVNLFLATAESVRDYFKNYLTIPKLSKAIPVVGQYLAPADAPFATVTAPIQKYVLDPVKNVLLRRHFILFALFALASRATSTDAMPHAVEAPHDPSLRGLPRLHALGHDCDHHGRDLGLPLALDDAGRPGACSWRRRQGGRGSPGVDRGHGPRPQVRGGARVEHLAPRLAGDRKTPGRAALPPISSRPVPRRHKLSREYPKLRARLGRVPLPTPSTRAATRL